MRQIKLATVDESGSSMIELALVLPVFMLLLLGAADFGRAYYVALELTESSHAAALYGAQNPTDKVGIQNVAIASAPDVPNFSASSVTVTTGCECSDGTSRVQDCTSTPSCPKNVVDYVQVVTVTNSATIFGGFGLPTALSLHGSTRLRTFH